MCGVEGDWCDEDDYLEFSAGHQEDARSDALPARLGPRGIILRSVLQPLEGRRDGFGQSHRRPYAERPAAVDRGRTRHPEIRVQLRTDTDTEHERWAFWE